MTDPSPQAAARAITVIIPHLNQPDFLARCLASLAAGTRQPDQVIVVDNGSAQMPHEICAAHSGTLLLQEKTPGPGPARNLGIAHAEHDILAFIDADCLADPTWLEEAAQAMKDPAATVLGGDVRIAYADPENLTTLEAYESIYAYRMDLYIPREGFTGTGNLVIRRPVWEDVGPFAGLGVAEDIDWGKRATAKGYVIRYVGGMKVYHPAREDFSELRKKWDRHVAHFYADHLEKPRGRLKWLIRTGAMAVSPIWEVGQCATSDRISGLSNRLRAWACLTRVRLYRTRIMLWLALTGRHEELSGQWNRPAKTSES